MLNRAQVVFVCLVPVLGLFSCSKDKDEWTLNEPMIVSSGETEPMGVSQASRRAFSSDAHLVFEDGAWSSLDVVAVCDLAGQFYEEQLTTTFRREIPLKSLWPASLLKNSNNAQLVQSQCDLRFVARTENGSSHDFELKRVHLLNFAATDRAQTFSAQKAITSDEATLTNSSEFLKTLVKESPDGATTTLACGNDSVSVSALEASRDGNIVRTLIRRLNLRGQRTCRFIVETAKTGLNDFEMTDEVAIQFPKIPVSFAWRFPQLARPQGMRTGAGLFVLVGVLKNEGTDPTVLTIPRTTSLNIRSIALGNLVQGFASSQTFFEGEVGPNLAFVSQLTGPPYVIVGDSYEAVLNPGEETTFAVNLGDTGSVGGCIYAGGGVALRLGLGQLFSIKQRDQTDADFKVDVALVPAADTFELPWVSIFDDASVFAITRIDPHHLEPISRMANYRPSGNGCL